MIYTIYAALKQRLTTALPELKETAWDMGQGTTSNKGAIKTLPAVYITFDPLNTQPLSKGVQMAQISFTVRLVSDVLKDGDNRVLDVSAQSHPTWVQRVYAALAGFTATLADLPGYNGPKPDRVIINTVRRTGIVPDHDNAALMQTRLKFSAVAYDFADMKTYVPWSNPIPVALQVDARLAENVSVILTLT